MRIKFRLAWGYAPDPAVLERLNALLGQTVKTEEREGKLVTRGYEEYEADLAALLATGVPASYLQLEGLADPRPLLDLAEAVRELRATVERAALAAPAVNDRVRVAVPGNGLLRIRQVQVVRDSCTDFLQEQLDAGWRILAICPQPDQRRPDYILGRVKDDR